jgi:hypothetical protein
MAGRRADISVGSTFPTKSRRTLVMPRFVGHAIAQVPKAGIHVFVNTKGRFLDVSEVLGHSNIATTAIYPHVMPSMELAVADRMDAAVGE